jgi:hypothetical protein
MGEAKERIMQSTNEISESAMVQLQEIAEQLATPRPSLSIQRAESVPLELRNGKVARKGRCQNCSLYVIEPVCGVEGREDRGSGPMHAKGLVLAAMSGGGVLMAAEAGQPNVAEHKNAWWNYGAPHGTASNVEISYRPVGYLRGGKVIVGTEDLHYHFGVPAIR